MISVIIPTMWKAPHLKKMLPMLDRHPLIGEIIIIDNDSRKTDFELMRRTSKLSYHSFTEGNIFVNPAWNHGVKVAKYDKLFLLNDDCLVNLFALNKIYDAIIPERGIFGFSLDSYCNYDIDAFDVLRDHGFGSNLMIEVIDPKDYIKLTGMPHIHYGSAMFMHRSNYYPIPEQFKIYFGDLFIYLTNLNRNIGNYMIENGLVMSKASLTVSSMTRDYFAEESLHVKEVFTQFGIANISYKIRRDA